MLVIYCLALLIGGAVLLRRARPPRPREGDLVRLIVEDDGGTIDAILVRVADGEARVECTGDPDPRFVPLERLERMRYGWIADVRSYGGAR